MLDSILAIQLTIARLGEKELMNWWNTDIAYTLGGADFLIRLCGPRMAPLAAGEAILLAASTVEETIMMTMPGKAYSLFHPEPALRTALSRRFRHFKTYPEELPPSLAEILDPEREWSIPELFARLQSPLRAVFRGTSFGRELTLDKAIGELETIQALASTFSPEDRGVYTMPYFRISDAV